MDVPSSEEVLALLVMSGLHIYVKKWKTCLSGLELCGGVVTVSFSKYLPWQVMHFLQHSTHFSSNKVSPLTFQMAPVVAPPS
jgi:hypothetical protein